MQFASIVALAASAAVVSAHNNTTHPSVPVAPGPVPLPSGSKNGTRGDVSSTVIVTVTHCESNICHTTTSAAIASISEATIPSGTTYYVTQYTTYCPLTDTTANAPPAEPTAPAAPTAPGAPEGPAGPSEPSSAPPAPESPAVTTPAESTLAGSSVQQISSFTGAAVKVLPAAGALFAGAAALLL